MGARVVVVGVGNLLAKDDGVGPRVIERLRERPMPPHVACVDAATDLLGVLLELAGVERLIVVDAMRAGGAPGTVYRMALEDLEARGRAEPLGLSLHDADVVEAVRMARVVGWPIPRTTVIGMEPGEIGLGTDLTPAAREGLEGLVAAVLEEIGRA